MLVPRSVAPRLLVAVAVLSGVAAVAAILSRWASVAVERCVPDGIFGSVGVHLALVRHDAACGPGSLAVGGEARQVMAVVIMVAIPVLVLHIAGVLAGFGLWSRMRAVVHDVVGVLTGRLWVAEPAASPVRPVGNLGIVAPIALVSAAPVGVPLRRGPPGQPA